MKDIVEVINEAIEFNGEVEDVKTLTSDELRAIDGKTVKFAPEGANYLGFYFDPYADVAVYEKEGEYFKTYRYVGD